MKNKSGIVIYLLICFTVIAASIYFGGRHHEDCRECRLVMKQAVKENDNFASWK